MERLTKKLRYAETLLREKLNPRYVYYTIKHRVECTVMKIDHLRSWAPVIWNDMDWDHEFFLKIVRHKLWRMYLFHKNHSHLEKGPETAEEIYEAWSVINSYIERDDEEEFFSDHKKKYGELGKADFYPLRTYFSKCNTDKEHDEAFRAWGDTLEAYEMMKSKQLEEVFLYIGQHIENWWD